MSDGTGDGAPSPFAIPDSALAAIKAADEERERSLEAARAAGAEARQRRESDGEPTYDPLTGRWTPSCPFGDLCSGCDAIGKCSRMEIDPELGEDDGGGISYADFFPPADVATFKRIKKGQMRLATIARLCAAEMVGADLAENPDHREYVSTAAGRFRLAMSANSDNRAELRAHTEAGAVIILMGDPASIGHFFAMHGLDTAQALTDWKAKIRRAL